MLRQDIYFIAYKHLYANNGAGTKGVNGDTADGFSEEYVTRIIEALRTDAYHPKPVRRTYIQKANGKMRPLGLPTFADKLVQEVMRILREFIDKILISKNSGRKGRGAGNKVQEIEIVYNFIDAFDFGRAARQVQIDNEIAKVDII